MKRILSILMICFLCCGLLSGCRPSPATDDQSETTGTTQPSQETIPIQILPSGSGVDFIPPTLPVGLVPENTDDSDYQIPPGEEPTINHEEQ